MMLLSSAAPYQCTESISQSSGKVCGVEDKRNSVNDRLLIRHLIGEETSTYNFNITAVVHLEDAEAYSGPQDLAVDTCNKQPFTVTGRLCQWSYTCEFDPLRLPPYIYRAQLITQKNKQLAVVGSKNAPDECSCREVTAPVTVLKFQNCTLKEEEWILKPIQVAVGFTCLPLPGR